MFRKIEDAVHAWKGHRESTIKLFSALTDASLLQAVTEGHRNIGRISWHVIATIPEMMSRTGLSIGFDGSWEKMPENLTAAMIVDKYSAVTQSLIEAISRSWTDESLEVSDDLYGEQWKRGMTLNILLAHEIHHLGQLTILMRQAGLVVPGLYGPSKEEWSTYNVPEPEV